MPDQERSLRAFGFAVENQQGVFTGKVTISEGNEPNTGFRYNIESDAEIIQSKNLNHCHKVVLHPTKDDQPTTDHPEMTGRLFRTKFERTPDKVGFYILTSFLEGFGPDQVKTEIKISAIWRTHNRSTGKAYNEPLYTLSILPQNPDYQRAAAPAAQEPALEDTDIPF